MRYSCSLSFRELKNAIKISFFFYLGGLGTKIKFSSRKKNGEEYWYLRSGLGKNIGSVCRIYRGVHGCSSREFFLTDGVLGYEASRSVHRDSSGCIFR